MTTHRNPLCFECDECGDLQEFPPGADFIESWEELKEHEGWRCSNKNGQWRHFCSECVRAWAREQRQAGAGDEDSF